MKIKILQHTRLSTAGRALCLFSLFCLLPGAYAQEALSQEQDPGKDPGRTQCILTPYKNKVRLGEPIYLQITLINRMTLKGEPVAMKANSDMNPSGSLMIVFYPAENPHNVRRFIFEKEQNPSLLPQIDIFLQQDDYWAYVLPVCASPATITGYIVDQPGRYFFRGKLSMSIQGMQGNFSFPPCEIEILAPPQKEIEVYDELSYPEFSLAFQRYDLVDDSVFQQMEEIIAMHPDSLYAPHAHYALSAHQLKKNNARASLDHIEQAIEKAGKSIPMEVLLTQRAETHAMLGKPELAQDDLHKIRMINPGYFSVTASSLFAKKYLMLDVDDVMIDSMWQLFEP